MTSHLFFSSWGKVKADDSSQSGDRDESDVTRGDGCRWIVSGWDFPQPPQEAVHFFLFGRGKSDELDVWPDCAED